MSASYSVDQVFDTGLSFSCTFCFTEGREAIQLATILSHLAVNDVLGTPLPDADGGLDVRRTSYGYEKGIGRHGCREVIFTGKRSQDRCDPLKPLANNMPGVGLEPTSPCG